MTQVRTGAGIIKRKPRCIVAYNRYMGGVDISDRKIYHVSTERPSKRYWKKIFFNLLDMALLNAYELYRLNTDAAECKNRHDFLAKLVESLCTPDDVLAAIALPSVEHRFIYFLNNIFTFIFKVGYSALIVYFNLIFNYQSKFYTNSCLVNNPDSSF